MQSGGVIKNVNGVNSGIKFSYGMYIFIGIA